jgi:hypothetical protein
MHGCPHSRVGVFVRSDFDLFAKVSSIHVLLHHQSLAVHVSRSSSIHVLLHHQSLAVHGSRKAMHSFTVGRPFRGWPSTVTSASCHQKLAVDGWDVAGQDSA